MDDWRPERLAAIGARLGLCFADLTAPGERRVRTGDGLSIHVLDWGGKGPPVVLAHGGSLTGRTWDYAAAALRSEFRLIAPDLRGHGASDWAGSYPIEGYAMDLLATADGLGLERAHFVGMSLGGLAVCEFALAHPGRVLSLAMIDVAPRVDFEATARMRGFIREFPGADSVAEVVRMALAVSPRTDPQRLEYRMTTLLRRGADGRLAWKRDARRPADFPMILERLASLDERVRAIAAPFLFVRGGRSRVVTAEVARDFAARFANGRWIEIADAGHNVQEDNPKDLVAALRRFWNGA